MMSLLQPPKLEPDIHIEFTSALHLQCVMNGGWRTGGKIPFLIPPPPYDRWVVWGGGREGRISIIQYALPPCDGDREGGGSFHMLSSAEPTCHRGRELAQAAPHK
jgi:hypothetical protein